MKVLVASIGAAVLAVLAAVGGVAVSLASDAKPSVCVIGTATLIYTVARTAGRLRHNPRRGHPRRVPGPAAAVPVTLSSQ